jgi:DNA-directed RNA polymerase II subunit RPB1
MQNGDFVLFNRQPSLHKMSIMGHRARILPYSTFKLNLSVTTPYNADFDGDEMNMHLPQSYETKAEAMNIMHVPKQIVSPQSNRPVMGIVQDALIGIKLFTHRDNFITLDVLMNLIMWLDDFTGEIPIPAILKPKPLWTGKQIFSMFLPKVNLTRFTSDHNEKEKDNSGSGSGYVSYNLNDTIVQMEDGILLTGIVCKRTVGNSTGGLIHCIFNEFGSDKTMNFLNHTQRIVNQWLIYSGFTVGVSDIITEEATITKIGDVMYEAKELCKQTLLKARDGKLESQPGKSIQESFEVKVNGILNEARDRAGRFVQSSLKSTNNLKNMVIAGSKGNITNISQITACVGQQNVEGKRIPFCFNQRTLPHFTKDDLGPESRGFVENSYLSGLTPQEFFFHAMGGREGLIDTAVKTSETGYIQRRLVKALEDVMLKYDGTVRNSLGGVVQFLYGEDGMAGELIEDQKLEILLMDDLKMKKNFKFFEDEIDEIRFDQLENKLNKVLDNNVVMDLIYSENNPNYKIILDDEFHKLITIREEMREFIFSSGDDKQHFPVNIPRIILNTKKIFGINNSTKSDIHPLQLLDKVNELKSELILVNGNDQISKEAQYNGTMLFNAILSYNLSTKKIIFKDRLTNKALEYLLGEIKNKFFQAILRPGEMVGNIAAQSIGEPATQMTLNTFHFAGVSSKNVTLGVPRLKEIINVAKKLNTPSMTVHLKKENHDSEHLAKIIQSKIEFTNLMDVTVRTEIFYDPNIHKTIIEDDEEMVDIDFKLKYTEADEKIERLSPWVLRIELDSNLLIDKSVNIFYYIYIYLYIFYLFLIFIFKNLKILFINLVKIFSSLLISLQKK